MQKRSTRARRMLPWLTIIAALTLIPLLAACGGSPAAQPPPAQPALIEVTRIVEQPGPEVTREIEVTREVSVEVTRVVRENSGADDPGNLSSTPAAASRW